MPISYFILIPKQNNLHFLVHSLRRRGLTLEHLADQMLRAGATFAINMDGGSSSVLVESNRGAISRPTCLDVVAIQCERPVTSVLCVGHQQQQPPMFQNSVWL